MLKEIFAIFRFILPDATIRMAGGRGLFDDKGINVFKSGAKALSLEICLQLRE